MWTELRYCSVGDRIKASFLGNSDPADSRDHNWHEIYAMEEKTRGEYYVAIEGWRGGFVDGNKDVYKQV